MESSLLEQERVEAVSTAPVEKAVLTLDEAAEYLNVSPSTLRRWLNRPPFSDTVVLRRRNMLRISAAKLKALVMAGEGRPRKLGRGVQ